MGAAEEAARTVHCATGAEPVSPPRKESQRKPSFELHNSVDRSVADPACLCRIRIFLSRIPDTGSQRFRIPDPDQHPRI